MTRLTRHLAWTLAALVIASGGCAKHVTAPVARANLPPQVVAVSPPARSTHVENDAAIWARFDRDLDPSTVDTRHVRLKVDTRRLSITVAYDPATRIVRITPADGLELNVTHTVELEPGLRTADGDSLGAVYFWQFTTLSVRRARAPYPPDGATGESPFTELLWDGTEASAGPIHYQLSFGTDSSAVANHGAGSIDLTTTRYRPTFRWAQDTPNYWSIRSINYDTGDQIDGPVWRFDPLPSATPIDSVQVHLLNCFVGFVYNPPPFYIYRQTCNPSEILVGALYDNDHRWNLTTLSPAIRLAGATIHLAPPSNYQDGLSHGVQVLTVRSTGTVCTVGGPNPPVIPIPGIVLGSAQVLSNNQLAIDSDALSAAIEAMVRHSEQNALCLKASSEDHFLASLCSLTIRFYRPTAPPLAANSRRLAPPPPPNSRGPAPPP